MANLAPAFRRYTRKTRSSASDMNRLRDTVQGLSGLSASGGSVVDFIAGTPFISASERQQEYLIAIDAPPTGGSYQSWHEVIDAGDGTYPAPADGLTGSAALVAREVNGQTVPTGSVVPAWWSDTDPPALSFLAPAGGGGGATSPLTTKGDLWGFDAANNRVPAGADGRLLQADSAQTLGVGYSTNDLDAANHKLVNLTQAAAATDAVAAGRAINTGNGLTGGGDLTADRTHSVVVQMSVDLDAAGVKLVGDSASPGNRAIYSTDAGGNRGWNFTADTDGTLAANSDTRFATQKAVATYVASKVAGLLSFKGSTNCSGNPNYPAGAVGDSYIVSVAGRIGGASGTSVDVGDWYVCEIANAGGAEAAVGASWGHMEHNLVGALLASNNLSDVASAATARVNLGLGNVENTALSTWAGSGSVATVGTLMTGVWHGSIIDSTYGGTGVNNAGRTLTINTNSGTIAFGAAGKTLTVSNSLTFAGTDGTTMTFPATSQTILGLLGGTLLGALVTFASAAAGAGLNIPPGVAPTAPVNGDIWTTAAGLFARINGATVGPYTAGGAALTKTEAAGTTIATYAVLLDLTNVNGLIGGAWLKNTSGTASLNYRLTVKDLAGNVATSADTILGQNGIASWGFNTPVSEVGAIKPPYQEFKLEVKDGTGHATYDSFRSVVG